MRLLSADRISDIEMAAEGPGDDQGRSVSSAAGGSDSGGRGTHGRRGRARPPKYYRVGEVLEHSGLSRQSIHNYTAMCLLRESRRTMGGHRLYDDSVFERLDRIAELKAQGKALGQIRDYFARRGAG